MPGDCSSGEEHCVSALGPYYAYMYAGLNYGYVFVYINTMWNPGSMVNFTQAPDRRRWEVVEIVNPKPVLCHWINERGYRAYSHAANDCESVGVWLTNVLFD